MKNTIKFQREKQIKFEQMNQDKKFQKENNKKPMGFKPEPIWTPPA
jgi:hypothetical protein